MTFQLLPTLKTVVADKLPREDTRMRGGSISRTQNFHGRMNLEAMYHKVV